VWAAGAGQRRPRSWQLEHLLMFGYLTKVCHTGNSTALTTSHQWMIKLPDE
jgi:hypothetical protein